MEKLDDYLWGTKWYPWLWDHTVGPFHRLRRRWQQYQEIIKKFGGRVPRVGDVVCNCRFEHLPIVRFIDADTVELEGGGHYSLLHCCDPVPHPEWEHPAEQTKWSRHD